MPIVYIPLPETNRSILSKAYYQVVQQVMQQLRIPYGSLVTMYKGMEVARTDGQENLGSHTDPNTPTTISKRQVIVTATDEYNEDQLASTAVNYKEHQAIFHDPDIDLVVTPVYVMSDVTLQIKYVTPSKSEAQQLRDSLRIRISQMHNVMQHELDYDLLFPEPAQELIADCHELKKRLYPSELAEYFFSYASRQTYTMTDTANAENTHVVVKDRQVRVMGRFEFNPLPEVVEEDNDTNSYRLTIPYKFSMEVARGVSVSYNPVVCNRLMPKRHLQWVQDLKARTRQENNRNLTYTHSGVALSRFEAHRQLDYQFNNRLPINIPLFDDFPLRQGHPGYVITTTFLTAVDEGDMQTLFDLRKIPDFYMNETLLVFIAQGERAYVTTPYQSLFYFGLHYPGKYFDAGHLEVTADLKVRSKVKLPLDKPTRVTFSVLADPSYITDEIIRRWYKYQGVSSLYVGEYIQALRDYKLELKDCVTDDLSSQKAILEFLRLGARDKDALYVKDILETVQQDTLLYERLMTQLRDQEGSTYNKLAQLVPSIKMENYQSLYAGGDSASHPPRTVMTAYVQAHKAP